jgi:hypothetical protein
MAGRSEVSPAAAAGTVRWKLVPMVSPVRVTVSARWGEQAAIRINEASTATGVQR